MKSVDVVVGEDGQDTFVTSRRFHLRATRQRSDTPPVDRTRARTGSGKTSTSSRSLNCRQTTARSLSRRTEA